MWTIQPASGPAAETRGKRTHDPQADVPV